MELDNYKKDKLVIDLTKANLYGLLLMIPVFIIYVGPYAFLWRKQFSLNFIQETFSKLSESQTVASTFLIIVGVAILGIVLHELIHGLTWSFYAKNGFKSMKFGVLWKMLTPYCHCKEPLKVKYYILGAVMPAILLGVFPAIYGIVVGSPAWLTFGIFFTIAAIGDFMIIYLLRNENPETWVQDHPSEAGCYVYRPDSAD